MFSSVFPAFSVNFDQRSGAEHPNAGRNIQQYSIFCTFELFLSCKSLTLNYNIKVDCKHYWFVQSEGKQSETHYFQAIG